MINDISDDQFDRMLDQHFSNDHSIKVSLSLKLFHDSLSKEDKKKRAKAQAEIKGTLTEEQHLEIYNKSLSIKRFQNLYKKLAIEYSIEKATVQGIAGNYKNLVDPEIHKNNMDRLDQEWKEYLESRKQKKKEKGDQWRKENRDQWIYKFISPGYKNIQLYDFYNNQRTSNQRMPVPPSLVYMFREQKFTAKEAKEFCKSNNIYEGTDESYWYKLVKFNYPWYSENEGTINSFQNIKEATDFFNKTFNTNKSIGLVIDIFCKSELKKFGLGAGWIFLREPKIK